MLRCCPCRLRCRRRAVAALAQPNPRPQTAKHAKLAAGKRMTGEQAQGFISSGLFRFSRHPNFWWAHVGSCGRQPGEGDAAGQGSTAVVACIGRSLHALLANPRLPPALSICLPPVPLPPATLQGGAVPVVVDVPVWSGRLW